MAVLDLGLGHRFTPAFGREGEHVGWMHHHTAPDGQPCVSFCAIVPGYGAEVHRVEQAEPLTLSPSLKCRACGSHGVVTKGRWSYLS